jgi:hypothetical protein
MIAEMTGPSTTLARQIQWLRVAATITTAKANSAPILARMTVVRHSGSNFRGRSGFFIGLSRLARCSPQQRRRASVSNGGGRPRERGRFLGAAGGIATSDSLALHVRSLSVVMVRMVVVAPSALIAATDLLSTRSCPILTFVGVVPRPVESRPRRSPRFDAVTRLGMG